MPPAPSKRHQRETIILRAMVIRTWLAYAAIAFTAVLFTPVIVRAFEASEFLQAVFLIVALTALYLAIGGALCAAFISQLRRWPSPGPNCVIRGGHFVRTWLWSAPKILAYLATREG